MLSWRGGVVARSTSKTLKIVSVVARKKRLGYRETWGKKDIGGLSMAGRRQKKRPALCGPCGVVAWYRSRPSAY